VTAPINKIRQPPYKTAGVVLVLVGVGLLVLVFLQFQGRFIPRTQLTMMSDRAGLSMDKGGKVTFNGVEIGRVAGIQEVRVNGEPKARFTLDVDPKFIHLIPKNVVAQLKATTVFGNKYVSFTSPKGTPQPIPPGDVINSKDTIWVKQVPPGNNPDGVTTEFNTLFETVVSISEKVDPVKLNETLAATAQALDGLGDRFGQSIIRGNEILDTLNPQMPQIRYDTQKLAALADAYANASPDLWAFLRNAVTTTRTLHEEESNIDAALMASVGFGNTGGDVFERGGPYLVRGVQDLIPTSQLLNTYSPELLCTIRNFHDVAPKVADSLGGNGYSLRTHSEVLGAANPYVYPDNLPRVNARGGPEGKPGCWQEVNRDLWPAPYLVMDDGASIAPYNHFELGSPFAIEYVWGRQVGEWTINP
jgi:phospholipid/cholesterol/gamma-HCH transport system substrate-binding protein